MDIVSTEAGPTNAIFPEAPAGVWMVEAQTARGDCYIHQRTDLTEEDAKNLAKVVGLALKITEERWNFWRTIYGSAAFEEEESEAAAAKHLILSGQATERDFEGTRVGQLL